MEDWESSDEEQDVQEPIDTVIKEEKRKRKYGNTQDLLNNIDLLIGGAELEEEGESNSWRGVSQEVCMQDHGVYLMCITFR